MAHSPRVPARSTSPRWPPRSRRCVSRPGPSSRRSSRPWPRWSSTCGQRAGNVPKIRLVSSAKLDRLAARVTKVQPDPVQEMDDLLMRTSAVLSGSGHRTGELTTGKYDDGLISVIVGPDGDVASISVDPTMLRRPAIELADAIAAAVNQAVDARPAESSTSSLIEELKAIQKQSAEQMKRMSGALTAAVTRLGAQWSWRASS